MNTRSTLGSLRSRRRIAYARAAKRYRNVPFLPQYALLRPPFVYIIQCVQHGGHEALRRAGLSVTAESCLTQ